jgi:hypothetical protein
MPSVQEEKMRGNKGTTMRAITRRTKSIGTIFILCILALLASFEVITAAEQPPKASVAKTTKTKPTPKQTAEKKLRSQSKTTGKADLLVTEDMALATFDAFTIEWMKKLEDTEPFHKTKAQVIQSTEGFSAEYTGYLPHRYIRVKKTESTDTPYVGILTYYEKKLRCTGKTKEEALQGPFDQVDTSPVSEIFRFTKGKWVY